MYEIGELNRSCIIILNDEYYVLSTSKYIDIQYEEQPTINDNITILVNLVNINFTSLSYAVKLQNIGCCIKILFH